MTATLDELEQRVAALEADQAVDQLNNNVLTVNPDGTVTATFAGVIVAGPGSTIPASSVTGQLTDAQLQAIAAAKVSGQLTDAQLQAIAANKVTGQLTDTQIAALAAAKITGLLTDAQINTLAAAKITGQLTDSQLQALTTSKLVGAVNATTIISPGSVTTGLIAANAIVAGLIAANSIDSTKITAGAIDSTKITANAIVAALIAADAIDGSKIEIPSTTSLTTPAASSALEFVDAAAHITAQIYNVRDPAGIGSTLVLSATTDPADAGPSSVQASARFAAGGGASATIVDSNGGSSFLRVPGTAAAHQITAGSGIVTWPGGVKPSGSATFGHGLGVTPTAVSVTPFINGNEDIYGYVIGFDATNLVIQLAAADGFPANGTSRSFFWTAIS